MDETNKTQNTVAPVSSDAEANKMMAVLAYIIFLIPIFAAKDSEFAKYHANQGTWLVIIGLGLYIVISIVTLGCGTLFAWIPWTVYAIIGILNALNGKMQPLPGFASLPVLVK